MKEKEMSIVVLSCDNYSDLWDDFFTLKETFWADCNFDTYLVNNERQYNRKGVTVINGGQKLNWSARFRFAVENIDTPYICVFLDDYFIASKVDNILVNELLEFVYTEKVSFLNLGDVFNHIIDLPEKCYFTNHEIIIPGNLKYGVDTAAAIWDREYLLEKLGSGDYSAWQFEKDRCDEAKTLEGIGGLLLCDDRKPLNVSEIPVVIQGKFYPKAISYFKKRGYNIDYSHRKVMNCFEVIKYKLKCRLARVKYGRRIIKRIASILFGYKFITED